MNSIIITGAGSGIGRATAVAFAEAGWSVGLVGRRREALEETARMAGGGLVLAGDVTKAEAVDAMFAEAVASLGGWMRCSTMRGAARGRARSTRRRWKTGMPCWT